MKKIKVPLSIEEMDEIREGRTFEWVFDGVDVSIFLETGEEDEE